MSLPLTTNFLQNVTEPSEGISYPVGDLCQLFRKNDHIHFTNRSLLFPSMFCHPTAGNFDVSL